MAVRKRFMNAVFFLSDESRELLTWKTSIPCYQIASSVSWKGNSLLSSAHARAFSSRSSPERLVSTDCAFMTTSSDVGSKQEDTHVFSGGPSKVGKDRQEGAVPEGPTSKKTGS